jgi:hypothetical protein
VSVLKLSIRKYAEHRGVSPAAVRKAISSGRIERSADGTIDAESADAAWGKNTDSARQRVNATPRRASDRAVPSETVASVRETLRENGEAAGTGRMTFVEARTANEIIKAQRARLKLRKEKGELVDVTKATAHVHALARRERDSWIAWPARIAPLLAAEIGADPHTMLTALETHVRQHLDELAGIRVELA